jgi:hypothetical protein
MNAHFITMNTGDSGRKKHWSTVPTKINDFFVIILHNKIVLSHLCGGMSLTNISYDLTLSSWQYTMKSSWVISHVNVEWILMFQRCLWLQHQGQSDAVWAQTDIEPVQNYTMCTQHWSHQCMMTVSVTSDTSITLTWLITWGDFIVTSVSFNCNILWFSESRNSIISVQ